jgi:hypothetical protein
MPRLSDRGSNVAKPQKCWVLQGDRRQKFAEAAYKRGIFIQYQCLAISISASFASELIEKPRHINDLAA